MNCAVELAHTTGILSAASLMVSGPAASDAIAVARRLPRLRVGLHLVLADGEPTLAPQRISALVDRDGRLRADLSALGTRVFFDRAARAQLAAEVAAQFEAFAATGLVLDHVNAHHHFYLHPTVAAIVTDVGRRHGLRALRVPREPREFLDAVERQRAHRTDWTIAPWVALLGRRARRTGLTTTDRVFGLAWSGALDESRLAALLQRLPDGATEIYGHPAMTDDFAGATQGYRYRDELEALCSPAIRDAARASGARIGGFADLDRP